MKNNKKVKTKKSIKEKSNKKILSEKDESIQTLSAEVESLKDKNVRLLAEFDNFQRRSFAEKEALNKYQGIDLLKDLLPGFDDIERAIWTLKDLGLS